jgi:hypothetical protein
MTKSHSGSGASSCAVAGNKAVANAGTTCAAEARRVPFRCCCNRWLRRRGRVDPFAVLLYVGTGTLGSVASSTVGIMSGQTMGAGAGLVTGMVGGCTGGDVNPGGMVGVGAKVGSAVIRVGINGEGAPIGLGINTLGDAPTWSRRTSASLSSVQ